MSSSHYVCYQNSAIVHFNITTLDHGYKTWKERYIKHFETLGNDDELLGQDPPQTANNIHPYNTMQKRRVINSSNVKFNRQKSFMSRNFHPKPRHPLRDQKTKSYPSASKVRLDNKVLLWIRLYIQNPRQSKDIRDMDERNPHGRKVRYPWFDALTYVYKMYNTWVVKFSPLGFFSLRSTTVVTGLIIPW